MLVNWKKPVGCDENDHSPWFRNPEQFCRGSPSVCPIFGTRLPFGISIRRADMLKRFNAHRHVKVLRIERERTRIRLRKKFASVSITIAILVGTPAEVSVLSENCYVHCASAANAKHSNPAPSIVEPLYCWYGPFLRASSGLTHLLVSPVEIPSLHANLLTSPSGALQTKCPRSAVWRAARSTQLLCTGFLHRT